jgi:cell division septum initiation protein DivIVA
MTRPATDPGQTPAQPTEPGGRRAPTRADTAADTKEFARPQLDDRTTAMRTEGSFHVAWRGYDRRQVDTYQSRVENELAAARHAHERAVRGQAEAAERLRATQAEVVRLRGQLTNSPSAVSDRLREILDLAGQDAEQTRTDALAEADQIRARATNDAQTVVRQARKTAEDIINAAREDEQKTKAEMEQVQAATRQEFDSARAEAVNARKQADAEAVRLREQADAEARQLREQADAQAEARRNAADHQARERREHADAAAAARLSILERNVAELTRQRDDAFATLGGLHDAIAVTLETAAPVTEQAPNQAREPEA